MKSFNYHFNRENFGIRWFTYGDKQENRVKGGKDLRDKTTTKE